MSIIDLRSDTVTLPTEGMIQSIVDAEFGDDVSREDPTVNRLEELAADMLGTESAMLVPSGTQSNLVALMTHCRPGEEVIMEADAHIYYYEVGGMAAVAGLIPRLIKGRRGVFTPEQVREAHRGDDIHFPRSSLVTMENTHNRAGGTVWTPSQIRDVARTARELNMGVHIDGARIFNAAVALDVDPREYGREVDTISFCLSKSLAAPIGSVLVGSEEHIERARKFRKMLGGGMRQAGIIAAPGIYALENMVSRLSEDHENARILANGLCEMEGLEIDMETVQTNIVVADISLEGMDAETFADRARWEGVLITTFGPKTIRFVTHHGVVEEDVHEVLARIEAMLH
jgi:threonine aldolase